MLTLTHVLRNNLRIHRNLRNRACPTVADRPLYRHCMGIAREEGLSRIDALKYTIEIRSFYF